MLTRNDNYNEIYSKYKNLVLRAAYKYSEDRDIAEDVFQDTFLALYKDMCEKDYTSAEEYENISAWLYTTAKNCALNYIKKTKREVLNDEEKDETIAIEPARESTEEEYLRDMTKKRRQELQERILTGLMEKNPRWYEAIMEVCIMEVSQAKVAEKMNLSNDAFYVMLHRARSWIKKKYGVEYDELNRLE